jgi:hypothetical protein
MELLTKNSFLSLSKTEQIVMVINSGKELLTREDESYHMKLYLIFNLFVELIYENNKKTIVKVETPSIDLLIQNYKIDNDYSSQLHN